MTPLKRALPMLGLLALFGLYLVGKDRLFVLLFPQPPITVPGVVLEARPPGAPSCQQQFADLGLCNVRERLAKIETTLDDLKGAMPPAPAQPAAVARPVPIAPWTTATTRGDGARR